MESSGVGAYEMTLKLSVTLGYDSDLTPNELVHVQNAIFIALLNLPGSVEDYSIRVSHEDPSQSVNIEDLVSGV
jgi:hypothetical protein